MASAGQVADIFIISYFKLLFSDHNNLVKFYADNSQITRIRGNSKATSHFNKQLSFEALALYNPETTIIKIFDYNSTVIPDSEEIVVTVYGDIEANSKVSNFSQTFVLTESESKYFIISDVLTIFEYDNSNLVCAEMEQKSTAKSDFINRFNQNRTKPQEGVLRANTRIKPFFKS